MRIPGFNLCALLLILTIHGAASQQIRGPYHGSMSASERRLNRGVSLLSARTSAFPMAAEPEKESRDEPEFPPGEQPPSSAPAEVNYILDSSTVSPVSGVPPLILARFQGISQTDWWPPDPVVAAGPRHIIAAANKEFRIMSRDGSVLETIDARAWYSDLLPGCIPYDPRVLYDHFTGRYIMLWHDRVLTPPSSHLLLSVSTSDDPTGQWVSYKFRGDVLGSEPTETWADNGCLGFDSTGVYIVTNQFTFDKSNSTDSVIVKRIHKSELYSEHAQEIGWTDFSISQAFCVRPAVVYGPTDAFYLLEATSSRWAFGLVKLYRLEDGPGGARLTYTYVPVSPYKDPPNPGQLGGGRPLHCGWGYIHSEVQLRNGLLHAAFSIENPLATEFSALRYLCINTSTKTATQDITFGSPGHWYFFPAVAANQDGDVAITFARSGNDEYAGTFFTWRSATDRPELRPAVPIQPGRANYQQFIRGANRWGDYSGAAVDPNDNTSFWLTGEYAAGPNIWGTWINSVRLAPFQEPKLIADRHSIDFGNVGVNEFPIHTHVTIRNGGTPDLTVSSLECRPPFALVDPPLLPLRLALYDSLAIEITFSPSETGPAVGEFTIVSDDANDPTIILQLKGEGINLAGTVGGVIYAVQERKVGDGKFEDVLHFLDSGGGIQSSMVLGSSGQRSLTVDPSEGRLYGAARDDRGTVIMKIDGADGSAYPSYPIDLYGVEAICAVGPDTFYCGTSTGNVYRFIPSTGETALVASRDGVGFSGLVQSSAPAVLWASADLPVTNDTLYTVNVQSGSIAPVGTTGFSVSTESICRAYDGGLLGLVSSALVRIDTLTGNGSVQALVALDGLRAIAEGLPITQVAEGTSRSNTLRFKLEQNYPNPFNPSTTIRYEIPWRSQVSLTVFNTLGQQVAVLVQGEEDAGHHDVRFEASGLSSGVYFCRMSAGGYSSSRRILLLR